MQAAEEQESRLPPSFQPRDCRGWTRAESLRSGGLVSEDIRHTPAARDPDRESADGWPSHIHIIADPSGCSIVGLADLRGFFANKISWRIASGFLSLDRERSRVDQTTVLVADDRHGRILGTFFGVWRPVRLRVGVGVIFLIAVPSTDAEGDKNQQKNESQDRAYNRSNICPRECWARGWLGGYGECGGRLAQVDGGGVGGVGGARDGERDDVLGDRFDRITIRDMTSDWECCHA